MPEESKESTLLRVGVVAPTPPLVNQCAYPNSTTDLYFDDIGCRHPGLLVEWTQLTLRYTGLNYTVVPLTGVYEHYGVRLPNGSWDSYLKHVHEGNVDMLVCDMAISDTRKEDFDILDTNLRVDWAVLLPMYTVPTVNDYIIFPFRMFGANVWLCLLVLILLIYISVRMPLLVRQPARALYTLSKPLSQRNLPYIQQVHRCSRPLLVIVVALTSVLFMNLYRSNLLFSIIRPVIHADAQSFAEVVEQVEAGTLRLWFSTPDSYLLDNLLSPELPAKSLYGRLRDALLSTNPPLYHNKNWTFVLEMLSEGTYGIAAIHPVAWTAMSLFSEWCNIRHIEVPVPYGHFSTGFAFRKNDTRFLSLFEDTFAYLATMFITISEGYRDHLLEPSNRRRKCRNIFEAKSLGALELRHYIGPAFIAALGLSAAILALLAEHIHLMLYRRRQQHWHERFALRSRTK